ncbi:hypothetical protein ACI2OX_02055 [Bacillus sp. N9]
MKKIAITYIFMAMFMLGVVISTPMIGHAHGKVHFSHKDMHPELLKNKRKNGELRRKEKMMKPYVKN